MEKTQTNDETFDINLNAAKINKFYMKISKNTPKKCENSNSE